jgi:hypothetical protein
VSYSNITSTPNFQLAAFGQKGFRKLPSGFSLPAIEGEEYRVVYALQDSTITLVSVNGDGLTSQTLLAGTAVYGLFTSISCASGSVLAYIA